MTHIERSIQIAADPATVWSLAAKLDRVADWNPNVAFATCEGSGSVPPDGSVAAWGLGSTRTCHLSDGGAIDEVVSHWIEGREIQFAIGRHGGIRSADMGFAIAPSTIGTMVTAGADYHLAYGPLGSVIDRVAVNRNMGKMLEAALAGLKNHIESTSVETTHRKGRVRHD